MRVMCKPGSVGPGWATTQVYPARTTTPDYGPPDYAPPVSITGNGNDQIGNGNNGYVSLVGNDNIQTGTGSGTVYISGTGKKILNHGSGWTQI